MVCDRLCSILELPDHLLTKKTSIKISRETVPYWKRTWGFSCKKRHLDCHEISYIVKGSIAGTINNQKVDLTAGDMFWLNPRTPHSLQWPKDLIYYTVRFSIFCDNNEMILNEPFFILKNLSNQEFIFRNLTFVLKDQSKQLFRQEQIKSYLTLIAINIANNQYLSQKSSERREFSLFEKEKLIQFYQEHGFQNTSSNELADHLNFSRDYFSRIFKNTYNKSVRSWVFEEKMKYAARLIIDTDLNFLSVAEQIGYEDYYLFSRQFKKVFGISPKKYQIQQGQLFHLEPEQKKVFDSQTSISF